ncbi:tyrosine-type recombinase/integrase [Microbacterium sp. 22303]
MRLGGLVGLRSEDLDERQGFVTVRRPFSPDGHGRLAEQAPKSGKSRRVPILVELMPWLEAARGLGREHIFTGKLGGPFDSTNLARAVHWHAIRDQIATFADGRPLQFHDLRHTFLSRLARQGIAPAHIPKVAGHASITTTERDTHLSGTEAALAVHTAINAANRETTFQGSESAANSARIRETPGNPGVSIGSRSGLEPAASRS